MKPVWVVENYTKDKTFTELANQVRLQGFTVIEIKDDYKTDMFSNLWPTGTAVFIGSIAMLKIIGEDFPKHWYGIKVPTWDNYLCSRYYSYFGSLLFNDKYVMVTLTELARQRWLIYGMLGKNGVVFVRPDSGTKPFPAQLVDMQDLDEFLRVHETDRHSLALISTPKNIWWEGRFVCYQNEIIAHSTYKLQGLLIQVPSVPREALECCHRVLDVNYRPDVVFCVDICGIEGTNDYYLLELNAFSSSGLYACDKSKVVRRVSEIAELGDNQIPP